MAQFVKSDKKEETGDEGQSTSTEMLTILCQLMNLTLVIKKYQVSQQLLLTYVTSESVTKAEILW